jgi:hypothetical protein
MDVAQCSNKKSGRPNRRWKITLPRDKIEGLLGRDMGSPPRPYQVAIRAAPQPQVHTFTTASVEAFYDG